MTKRALKLTVALAAALLFALLLCAAQAEIGSGTTGDLTWVVSDDGTLTISGSGAMPDYSYYASSNRYSMPWYQYRGSIERIVVSEGVTSIGSYAFVAIGSTPCNATEVTLPSTLTRIGSHAFYYWKGSTVEIPAAVRNISASAFENAAITSVFIPEGVTTLLTKTFYNCTHLVTVGIPTTLTAARQYAFGQCSAIQNVLFGCTSIQGTTTASRAGGWAFIAFDDITANPLAKGYDSGSNGATLYCEGYPMGEVYLSAGDPYNGPHVKTSSQVSKVNYGRMFSRSGNRQRCVFCRNPNYRLCSVPESRNPLWITSSCYTAE